MVAPTQRGYHDPSLRRPYPRSKGQAPVEEESLALKRGDKGVPQFLGTVEDLGRHNQHLFSPLHDFYTGEGYNRDRSWATGIQQVAAPEQWYPGNDIFAGVPEPGTAPLPRPRPQQPNYYGPNINPFPGPPAPMRGIPYGTPERMPQHNYSAPPRRMIPPSMPMGPPGGFSRQLMPSSIPKVAPQAPDQMDTQKLMEMLKLLNGGFGGGSGGGGF